MALAFNLVAKAAAQVHRTAFKTLIQGDADDDSTFATPPNLDYGCPPAPCTVDCDRPDAGLLRQPADRQQPQSRLRMTFGQSAFDSFQRFMDKGLRRLLPATS
jgi:hypothetical protein